MKISLGTWAFSFGPYSDEPVAFDEVMRKAAATGYDGLEICGFPPHVTHDRYPTVESRRALARRIADAGLGVSGFSADWTTVNPVTEGHFEKYLELFRRNLELCAGVGSPMIRVDTGAAPGAIDDKDYDSAFERLAAIWHKAADLALEAGVLVAWEFEPGFSFNKPSEVVDLVHKVGHPNFSVLFDTAHAYTCSVTGARQHGTKEILKGGVVELLDKLAGSVGAVHLSDSDGTLYGDETSAHLPLGQGLIDWAATAGKLRQTPKVKWWCVDLCFIEGGWDLVDPGLAFARRLAASGS